MCMHVYTYIYIYIHIYIHIHIPYGVISHMAGWKHPLFLQVGPVVNVGEHQPHSIGFNLYRKEYPLVNSHNCGT